MNGLHRTIRIALMLSSLFAGSQAFAADSERDVAVEINKANGLLRSGAVDAAVKAYRQVQNGAPGRADLSYNMAVAQYRKGDVAAAEKLFSHASAAEDDALAAKARYNLGNCNYAAALRIAETDHPSAIKGLERAIENYRSAMEIDANDADSRANIELAAAMIDKLREQDNKQQQQQQQQKQQDQKQQQKKDQNQQKQESSKQQDNQEKKDSQKQQSKDQQQSQQNQQQKPDSSQEKKSQGEQGSQDQQKKKDESSKNQAGDKPESKAQEQKSQPQESKSEQKDAKSQSQDSKSQSQEHTKANSADDKQQSKPQNQSQAASKQKPKGQRPEQDESKQPEQAKEQQGTAAPKGALSAADQKAGKADPQGKEMADQPEVVPEGAMTVQEAEKMLQAIRDQEMIRRLKRQTAERNQHVPVDRDW
jgi:Ca-activated chloride channel family protein